MARLIFNGKFLSAPPSGVHRVAEEMIRAVDAALEGRPDLSAELVCPRDIRRDLPLRRIPRRRLGRATWQVWEQAELPFAGEGLLVNLCNLGPALRREAITMIHDAQVIETPESYGPAFRAYYRALQPLIARRHRAVLTVSGYAREALIRHGVAPAARLSVAPNGCDHVRRAPPDRTAWARFGLPPGGYVLAPATAQAHKNIRLLIEAMRARPAGLTLALFGETPAGAIAPDPPPWVRTLGRVSDAELFGLMAGAAAFACPSLTEGFGLPPLEAMAMGAPVVAAPCGALPETCGDAALYADPHDAAAWAAAFARLAGDRALRARLAAAGAAQAARFTWERSAAALLAVVDALEAPQPCAA